MSGFEFLHAADLHLDSPLRGLDATAPAERIRGATRQALINMVELALQRNVAFVLLAGDLYDGDWKDWRTGHFLIEQLARLKRAGIEVIAIAGNHDADQVLTRKLPFPGTLIGSGRPERVLLETLRVAVHGQSFATRAVTENLALGYGRPVEDWFNIGLLHTACGSTEHDNYAPCSTADLASLGYQYWALGHVHARAILAADPWIVFPGNLQGRHIKEEGAKGATIVRVQDGRVAGRPEHHALDVLRWARLDVDCTGAADFEAIAARVAILLAGQLVEAQNRLLVVRLTLTGPAPRTPNCRATSMRRCSSSAPRPRTWRTAAPSGWKACASARARRSTRLRCGTRGGAVGALVSALAGMPALEGALQAHAAEILRRTDLALEAEHPAVALARGDLPEALVQRARDLLLGELARSGAGQAGSA